MFGTALVSLPSFRLRVVSDLNIKCTHIIFAASKRNLGQGTVLHLFVCSWGRRGSLYDITSCLAVWFYVLSEGGLCLWSHVLSGGVLCSFQGEGSLFRGLPDRDPRHGKERSAHILVECILVSSCEWFIKGSTN